MPYWIRPVIHALKLLHNMAAYLHVLMLCVRIARQLEDMSHVQSMATKGYQLVLQLWLCRMKKGATCIGVRTTDCTQC